MASCRKKLKLLRLFGHILHFFKKPVSLFSKIQFLSGVDDALYTNFSLGQLHLSKKIQFYIVFQSGIFHNTCFSVYLIYFFCKKKANLCFTLKG